MIAHRRGSVGPAFVVLLLAVGVLLGVIAWRYWGGTPASVAAMPLNSAARPDDLAVDWCLGHSPSEPQAQVISVGRRFFGMTRGNGDSGTAGLRDDPLFPQACALAYELLGLSDAEWDWCFDAGNRATWLEPTVKLLGLGRQEAAGTETFGEAPGDCPAEYDQACRFAYRFARPANALPAVDSQTHPFFALATDASAWCTDNPDRIAAAAVDLDIGSDALADSSSIAEREAFVRACRFARILNAASADAVSR
jgi:hypothetical protein